MLGPQPVWNGDSEPGSQAYLCLNSISATQQLGHPWRTLGLSQGLFPNLETWDSSISLGVTEKLQIWGNYLLDLQTGPNNFSIYYIGAKFFLHPEVPSFKEKLKKEIFMHNSFNVFNPRQREMPGENKCLEATVRLCFRSFVARNSFWTKIRIKKNSETWLSTLPS